MDTDTSFNLERAETQTCTSTEPSPVLAHSSSLEEVNGQLPLPATVTVSSDLVEDLLVQLMLGLNPLRSAIGAHLDQQELLTLCLHMSIETLETLKKVPGVIVDENLPPPPCNTWEAAVLLQSSLMKRFGTCIQVRKQLMRKDPELLSFIPRHVTEAVLTTHKAESAGESTPSQTPSDEESQLFSQFLPETTKEEMIEQYGSWIRKTKIFQRAFLNEDILEGQQDISDPHLSNRYAADCSDIVAWSLIITQMLNQQRPPLLSFEEETSSDDSLDTPDSREEIEPEREPTKPELFLVMDVIELQPEKKTKKNKFFSWLSKLTRCRKP